MTETRPWPVPPDPDDGLLIHHVSDTHWGYRPWSYAEGDHMLADLRQGLIPPVHVMVHTGDIIDGAAVATEDAYALGWLPAAAKSAPSLWAMGNHDLRTRTPATRAGWEAVYGRSANTYLDVGSYRIVTFAPDVDSNVISGRPGWWPPTVTWDWLDAAIDAAPGPVVIATHMPPWEIGGLADSDTVQPPGRYDQLVSDHPQIVGILSGHMHWEIDDVRAARFVAMGGRSIPVLTDISSMLSIDGQSRDRSGQYQSYSAYVSLLPGRWEVRDRAHGTHAWSGPAGQRVTTLDLTSGTVSHGM